MTAESSSRLKSPDSFGETAAAPCDVARAGKVRTRVAVVVLLLGFGVAFVPGLAVGEGFVRAIRVLTRTWHERWFDTCDDPWKDLCVRTGRNGTSASDLVRSDSAWAVIAATLAFVPVLFGWWRRASFSFARTAGMACAVAASVSAVALVASMRGLSDLPEGVWWTVPAGGLLMAAGFVVAPAPPRRDE